MQEEVENRTINLAISTTRLTARSIIAGIRKYLQHREKVKARKGTRDTAVHGKQSVKPVSYTHLDVYKRQTQVRQSSIRL